MATHKRKAAIVQQEEQIESESGELPPLDDGNDVSGLIEQAPDVTQTVIDLENAKVNEANEQIKAAGVVSNTFRANGFDPAIHEADANGNPVLTPTGRFKKKGSRPARGAPKASGSSTLGGIPNVNAGDSAAQLTNAQTAAVVTQLKETMLVVAISDEFVMAPHEKQAETLLLTAALNHSYPDGMPMNPWLAYSAAVISHAASRFGQPKTQSWFERQKNRFAVLYLKMKGRKLNATHSSNGADNVGKNDTGSAKDGGAQTTAKS